eukprot:TRINITY_DN62006_c0_g1_i1.p1 TRINITY_DN62006_c0_g1~~TRINITY_DN62006_c0_g1_i1.p1  ORF type:complete len:428 (+),score=114.83 TRINITY_DN62006_c0_g1_i1:24-1286(+)
MEDAVAQQDAALLASLVKAQLAGNAASALELLQLAAEVISKELAAVEEPLPPITPGAAAEGEDSAIVSLPNLSLAVPRGRFDLSLTSAGVILRGKVGKAGLQQLGPVRWSNVTHTLKLPKQEGSRKAGAPARTYLLTLVLAEPLTIGKQEYSCLVVNADGVKPMQSLPAVAASEKGELAARLAQARAALEKEEQLSEHIVLSHLFAASLGVPKALEPDAEFCSLEAVQAWKGVEEGTLYPLRAGLCFLTKPAIFLSAEDILSAEAGRGGGPRGGELVVHRVSAKIPYVFSNLSRSDVPLLLAYLSKLRNSGLGGEEADKEDDEEADPDFVAEEAEVEEPPVKRRCTRGQLQASLSSASSSTAKPAESAKLISELPALADRIDRIANIDEDDDEEGAEAEGEESEEEPDVGDDDDVIVSTS